MTSERPLSTQECEGCIVQNDAYVRAEQECQDLRKRLERDREVCRERGEQIDELEGGNLLRLMAGVVYGLLIGGGLVWVLMR